MEEALKCWNLERIIEAEAFGQPMPEHLTMNDLVMEENDSSQDDVVVV